MERWLKDYVDGLEPERFKALMEQLDAKSELHDYMLKVYYGTKE